MVGQRTKIYQMSKSELISELEKKGLSTEGKVPELKNRLLEALSNTGSKSSKINTPSQSSRPSRTASIERSVGVNKSRQSDGGIPEDAVATPRKLRRALGRTANASADEKNLSTPRKDTKAPPEIDPEVIVQYADENETTPIRVPGGGKAKKMDEEFIDPNDIRIKNLIQQHRSRHNKEKTDKEKESRDPTQVRHRENRERHSRSPSERDFGDDLTGIFKHPDDIEDREQEEENRLWEQYKRQFVNRRSYQPDTRQSGQNKSHVDFTTEELEIMRELEIKKIRDKIRREEEGRMREAKVRMEYEVRTELRREYEEDLRRERQMILEEEQRKFEKYKEYQRKLEEEKLSGETERLRKNYHDDVEYKMSAKPPTPAPRRKLHYSPEYRERSRDNYRERSPEKDRFRERYTYDRRDDRGWYRSEDRGSYGWDDGKHLNPVELIRKWGITFDGEESVLNYVERVEELSLCSGIHKDRLLKYIPVMFKGVALLWFRNNFKFWRTWNEFIIDLKKAYLPKDFEFRMEEEINARKQKSGERIRVYVTELLTLMRRHGSMSEEKQLYFLYRNLAEPYKMYIKKTAAVSIDAILKEGTDYENDILKLDKDKHPTLEIPSKKEKKNQPREEHNNQEKDKKKKSVNAVAAEEKYVSRERCWKCRQKRHENGVCNNPPVKFCMFCGILGKWTTECSCPKPRWWTERRQAGRGAARNNQNAGAVVSNSAPVSGQASATSNQQAPVVNQNANSR
ncbi:trichohyalin-like, partial [Diachasma alloeum]|uniref:trichohyalin-like n=1 Tax=Diachasma alloeum TaxID=454923 RepID=UPI0010FB1C53